MKTKTSSDIEKEARKIYKAFKDYGDARECGEIILPPSEKDIAKGLNKIVKSLIKESFQKGWLTGHKQTWDCNKIQGYNQAVKQQTKLAKEIEG